MTIAPLIPEISRNQPADRRADHIEIASDHLLDCTFQTRTRARRPNAEITKWRPLNAHPGDPMKVMRWLMFTLIGLEILRWLDIHVDVPA